jgi:hypothetical protein
MNWTNVWNRQRSASQNAKEFLTIQRNLHSKERKNPGQGDQAVDFSPACPFAEGKWIFVVAEERPSRRVYKNWIQIIAAIATGSSKPPPDYLIHAFNKPSTICRRYDAFRQRGNHGYTFSKNCRNQSPKPEHPN